MKNTNEVPKLLRLYKNRKEAIKLRLQDFSRVTPSGYFYELVYCLMTPQSSAEHAEKTVLALRQQRFAESDFNPEEILRTREHYIRFHRTKARHLLKAKEEFPTILESLTNGLSPMEVRNWLVSNVKGLGLKEATHFMRNIGKNDGLAILDRHILRNLTRFGVIRSVPSTLSRKKYLSIEKKFASFAQSVNIPVDELDLLFWSMETGEIRK
ncbi:MAG: N-glycosylase/DNA lyase [Bacteroidetes bacterium]|nr:N-glycosylase/DNA lyase [Bacteroidota bacterium]